MTIAYIPPLLRELTGGIDHVEVDGTNIRQIVEALEARFPGIRDRLCDDSGLRRGLVVAVNGAVSRLGLIEKVPDGSEVHFLPATGGG